MSFFNLQEISSFLSDWPWRFKTDNFSDWTKLAKMPLSLNRLFDKCLMKRSWFTLIKISYLKQMTVWIFCPLRMRNSQIVGHERDTHLSHLHTCFETSTLTQHTHSNVHRTGARVIRKRRFLCSRSTQLNGVWNSIFVPDLKYACD